MTVSDPIADMLTRIRNAVMVRHETVAIPASRMKLALAKILKDEGFITDYEVIKAKPQRLIKVHLRYVERNQPGRRPGAGQQAGATGLRGTRRDSAPLRRPGTGHPVYAEGPHDRPASLAAEDRRGAPVLRLVGRSGSEIHV